MFGLGTGELLIIAIVALLFLGPDRLPEAAKKVSQGIRDLRRAKKELQRTVERDSTVGDVVGDLKSALHDTLGETPKSRMARRVPTAPPAADRNDATPPSTQTTPEAPGSGEDDSGQPGEASAQPQARMMRRVPTSRRGAKPAKAAATIANQPTPKTPDSEEEK